MTRLPLRSIEHAPSEARELLAAAKMRNGHLPNLLRGLANAPAARETDLTVSSLNARASLSLAGRDALHLTAALKTGNIFCDQPVPAVVATGRNQDNLPLNTSRYAGWNR